jgi:hypothetical protein
MRAPAQLPSQLSFGTTLMLTVLVAVAMVVTACSSSVQQPPPTPKTKVYTCKDRPIKIDKNYKHGVDQDVVVLCGGNSVSWKGSAPWEVRFTTSPFVGGATVITDTSLDPGPVIQEPADQDTAFKYSVTTSDGTKFDPQIIIMGGN